MTREKTLDGKPYVGNPHVRSSDEGEVALAMLKRGSLLYKNMKMKSCNITRAGSVATCLLASCLGGTALADAWSVSPASAWDTSTTGKVVFNSSSAGTLDSTTSTQSSSESPVGLSGAVSLEKRGTGTLTVNGMHSFSGNVDIYDGTYKVGSGATDKWNARNYTRRSDLSV